MYYAIGLECLAFKEGSVTNKAYFWGDQDVLHSQGETSVLLKEVHEESAQTGQESSRHFSTIELKHFIISLVNLSLYTFCIFLISNVKKNYFNKW